MTDQATTHPLPPGVLHVRCDNPSAMTLSGTNSYVITRADGVADGGERALVIDPGPDEHGHVGALVDAVRGVSNVDVLLTHHHDDHEGGAARLAELLSEAGVGARVWGGAQGIPLVDGQIFDDVQVVLAPGHTADSVAYVLERDGDVVLLSGDTLLGGSSSFIAHPDGDLTDYLVTLDVLEAALEATPGAVLAPGHGDVGGDALAVIDAYRHHRNERLDGVRAALAQAPSDADDAARVDAVIDGVYGGVDAALRPAVEAVVAAQLAHLMRIGEV